MPKNMKKLKTYKGDPAAEGRIAVRRDALERQINLELATLQRDLNTAYKTDDRVGVIKIQEKIAGLKTQKKKLRKIKFK